MSVTPHSASTAGGGGWGPTGDEVWVPRHGSELAMVQLGEVQVLAVARDPIEGSGVVQNKLSPATGGPAEVAR